MVQHFKIQNIKVQTFNFNQLGGFSYLDILSGIYQTLTGGFTQVSGVIF